ncbi:ATP-grasp domain-containing protein [Dasania marina]|uniref:carboxylate--amine ligase n=1 Tax=Dasania marina TaxID=471499 RepID=UPI0003824AE2|nr:ATP-grasp domain-containing protein [Dasania marina]
MLSTKTALILDGEQRSALAATRNLGKHGVTVFTASTDQHCLSSKSKFSTQHFIYPDPQNHPEQFLSWLLELTSTTEIDIIFPMTEVTCYTLAPYSPLLNNSILPIPTLEKIFTLSNKSELMKTAQSLNIPIPNTIYIHNSADIDANLSTITFPCVIKPSFSKHKSGNRWVSTAVHMVANKPQLIQLLDSTDYLRTQSFMIQEYIEGEGQGIFSLYNSGQDIAWFAHKRIREKPPWGGVSVLSTSINPPPNMVDISKKLLEHAQWSGVAMVEFKIAKDGTPYIMEVNTRFWGSLQLAIDSGVEFPYLLYATNTNNTYPAPIQITGTTLRWVLGDLDNLAIVLKSNASLKSKIASTCSFIFCFFQSNRNETLRLNDIGPGLFELKEYFLANIFKQ